MKYFWAAGSVTIDETTGNQAEDNDVTGPLTVFNGVTPTSTDMLQFAQSSAAVVNSTGSATGADDEGATTLFSLEVNGNGTTSLTTTDDSAITIAKEGDLIVGRDTGGNAVFAVSNQRHHGYFERGAIRIVDQPDCRQWYDAGWFL